MAPRRPRRRTPEQIAENRRQQEAKRNLNKNRKTHEEMRGISNTGNDQFTTEDVEHLVAAFEGESDRGLALIMAAMVENALECAISRRMPDLGAIMHKKVFQNEKAPMNSFYAKIVMGRAMSIYGPETETLLNGIRTIRNNFAHKLKPIDFLTPSINKLAYNLYIPGGIVPPLCKDTPRIRYRLSCNWVCGALIKNAMIQDETRFNADLP